MASSINYVEFVCEQIREVGSVRYKKMFGEYMVYCNEKPILLICDDTTFCKIMPETTKIVGLNNALDSPYKSAKLHYIIDVENQAQIIELAKTLEKIIPMPKKKVNQV